MSNAQEPEDTSSSGVAPRAEEISSVSTAPVEHVFTVQMQPFFFEEQAEEEADNDESEEESDSEEVTTPDWFLQCCVADHIEEFKKRDLIKKKFNGYESVVAHPIFLWDPEEEITYTFLPGRHSGTPNQRQIVSKAMTEWMQYANVKFRQIVNVEDSTIRISFNSKDGNWSRLGTSALRVQKKAATANFCDVPLKAAPSAQQRGVVLHEIGHMLGLKHEHQSPSVAGILTWIEKEVKAYFKQKCNWSPTMTTEQVLTAEDESHLSNWTHLDLKSIMMYPMPSSTNLIASGSKGVTIPTNDALSVYDKAFIAIHYPYLDGNPNTLEWDFERALQELELGETTNNLVMQKFRERKWKGIRDELPEWYFQQRARMNLIVMDNL